MALSSVFCNVNPLKILPEDYKITWNWHQNEAGPGGRVAVRGPGRQARCTNTDPISYDYDLCDVTEGYHKILQRKTGLDEGF